MRLVEPPASRRLSADALAAERARAADLLRQACETGRVIELTLAPAERAYTIRLRYQAVARELGYAVCFQTARYLSPLPRLAGHGARRGGGAAGARAPGRRGGRSLTDINRPTAASSRPPRRVIGSRRLCPATIAGARRCAASVQDRGDRLHHGHGMWWLR
jgi:hypothetical protein